LLNFEVKILQLILKGLVNALVCRHIFVGNHFTWFFKKVHRTPKHLEAFRPAMVVKIRLCIPFFKQTEIIFILQGMKEIATHATLFLPDIMKQGGNCLGQFLAFHGSNLYLHNDHDHNTRVIAKGMPTGKSRWKYMRKPLLAGDEVKLGKRQGGAV
jgi:hypothetical protein